MGSSGEGWLVGWRYPKVKPRQRRATAMAFLVLQSLSFHLSALLNHRAACIGGSSSVVVDLACFIGKESAVSRLANLLGYRRDGIRTNSPVHLFARCVREYIP